MKHKDTRKSHLKLTSFLRLFRLNFEDEEANYDSFWVFTLIGCHTDKTINMFIWNSGLLNVKSVVVDEEASSSDLWNWPHLTVSIF